MGEERLLSKPISMKTSFIARFTLSLLTLVLSLPSSINAQNVRTGTIKGLVMDAETREPLAGANVMLRGTTRGAATDLTGLFIIEDILVGSYTLDFSYIGYDSYAKSDVIVKSQRTAYVEVALDPTAVGAEGIVVESGYFNETEDQPNSIISFSHEEIRRVPGSAGDVSRIIYGLPSVAKVSDTKNSLIVRGGGPTENGFYVDNIEIPNINHFPEQGSSGGPIGMLNVDFIQDVDFYSGGFNTSFGDRMSSIMDIRFRKGNQEEFDAQLDMSFAGFGAVGEGRLGNKGSWLISARRSFLDLIVKAIDEDETSIPQYGDVQAKLFFNLSPKHQLSILNVSALDKISLSGEDAIANQENLYTDFEYSTITTGANWLYLWGKNGHSETSISHTIGQYDFQGFQTRSLLLDSPEPGLLFDLRPKEQVYKLRNRNYYRFGQSLSAEFGVEVKHITTDYNNFYGAYNDELGNATAAYRVDDDIEATKTAGFLSFKFQPNPRVTLTPGVRINHFSYNDELSFDPRLSARYQVSSTLAITGAAGIFHQQLPLPLVAQNESNKNLKTPVSYHLIIGLEKLLAEDTRLSLEAYTKLYEDFPLDSIQPELFIIDQVVSLDVFVNSNPLVSQGKAKTRGIEFMLQKKLAKRFYGLVSAAYFRSSYRDLNQTWRDRSFDNRFTFQLEGGYKPSNKWEFSGRWLLAGGRPYTPFDVDASTTARRGVLDVNQINAERLPSYHSLNVRFDRRFHYRNSNLIFYLSIWNVYGRTNVAALNWNEVLNEQEELEQWGMLPIFGLEFEF